MIARISSMKYVAGISVLIHWKILGIVSMGKMNPEKKTDGKMNIMVICSACIWFSARVEISRPRLRRQNT